MKKPFLITTLVIGITFSATLLASVFTPKLKQSKQELPLVIINGESTGIRGYVANFSVEISKSCPKDNPNRSSEQENLNFITGNSDGTISVMKHCSRCNIGIYSEHHDEEEVLNGVPVRRCTYCGDKEPR
jgi:hypothetical protein